jgi:hypothetical protein
VPAAALPLLVAAELVQLFMHAVYGVNRVSLEQAITPDHLRGRVRGSQAVVGAGALCRRTLDLENHGLRVRRDYLRRLAATGREGDQAFAAGALKLAAIPSEAP